MIIDITGVTLIPGEQGKNCPGNGETPGIECCCNECDYMICCFENPNMQHCLTCNDPDCPNRTVIS